MTRKKRNKIAIIVLAPVLALTFIIGWSLHWIGGSKRKQPQKRTVKTSTKQFDVELMTIPKQEAQQIAE